MTDNATQKINSKEALNKSKTVGLMYPSDLGSQGESKVTIFKIYKYSKSSVNKVENIESLGTIFLPIPAELSTGDALNYEEFSAPIASAAMDAFNKENSSGNALAALGISASASLISSIKGGSNLINQVSALTGTSINPRNTNIFKNPNAREYTFSYKLVAKSLEESISIRQIVNKFRYHAYPEAGESEVLYSAPDLFKISFKYNRDSDDDRNTYLFHPLPSALTSINVSYNGSSTPTFFQNSGAPVEVTITLSFKEMEIDNKAKLLERYAIDGVESKKLDDSKLLLDQSAISGNSKSNTQPFFVAPANKKITFGL